MEEFETIETKITLKEKIKEVAGQTKTKVIVGVTALIALVVVGGVVNANKLENESLEDYEILTDDDEVVVDIETE